jgi:hypothetical protein
MRGTEASKAKSTDQKQKQTVDNDITALYFEANGDGSAFIMVGQHQRFLGMGFRFD